MSEDTDSRFERDWGDEGIDTGWRQYVSKKFEIGHALHRVRERAGFSTVLPSPPNLGEREE